MKLRLGVSQCLLGDQVRYDGRHKLDLRVRDVLGRFVEYVPVCPEVELGMGIPREPIHLEMREGRIVLLGNETFTDHTDAMTRFARARVEELRALHLSGYIFKSKSPSCGVTLVPGPGLFAQAVIEALPGLPLIEERQLVEPALRRQFLERVLAFGRARILRRFV